MNDNNLKSNLISALTEYFNENKQGYTSFRFHIDSILKEHIKPLTSRSMNSSKSKNNGWRQDLMNRFKGRGSKWVFVSLKEIEPTLKKLEDQGINCQDYRKNTKCLNKAWIRFMGPRIINGTPHASFEVRTQGSTIYQPHQLHYISLENIKVDSENSYITLMKSTPKALKLEEDFKSNSKTLEETKEKVKKMRNKTEKKISQKENKVIDSENVEINLSDIPSSNNPDDWEDFLSAEGLIDFDDLDL